MSKSSQFTAGSVYMCVCVCEGNSICMILDFQRAITLTRKVHFLGGFMEV